MMLHVCNFLDIGTELKRFEGSSLYLNIHMWPFHSLLIVFHRDPVYKLITKSIFASIYNAESTSINLESHSADRPLLQLLIWKQYARISDFINTRWKMLIELNSAK